MRRLSAIVLLILAVDAIAAQRQRAIGRRLPPLDTETLYRVSFMEHHPVSLQPGQSHSFKLGILQCCVFFEEVKANVEWSVEPRLQRASIDQHGVLTIAPNATNGEGYRVYAEIDGRRILSYDAHVYTREENPLVAIRGFRQIGELPCDGSNRVEPVRGTTIEDMRVHADGSFEVTWTPFEVYTDYWGSFFARKNRITFGIRHGNHIPESFDGDGTYELVKVGDPEAVQGYTRQRYHLFLRDIWLGKRYGEESSALCGVVLEGWMDY